MKKDTELTDVIFRVDTTKEFKGDVFALLPHEVADYKGNVAFYTHFGQHSAADYSYCIRTSRPATPAEYAPLKREMEGFGYNFNVIQRQRHAKFIKSYREARKEVVS